jgi:gas vesicle protein
MNEVDKVREETSHMLKNVEEQVGDLVKTLEEQDTQVWAYLIGGVVALLVGLLAAYLYSQSVRERRKSTLERIKDALRGGVSR